ncbi:HNH endonuclease [Xanthomonas euroxanthea]|uniref:HNH endonuclease 5 domain-containing protein n=2 Tax=Xanthomonas euroxanthea TaxID=2259622 RepID=A0AA46CBX2_9XANT|nr:HNH endonuclease [Xanthomonas euroxanthea]CAE1139576.1 HNH endonuclease [Xanthomonas euroxanthea]SUZ29887.1 hypothetical protein CPBF424_37360 [Xanthomonas euroxanthea]
MQKSFDIECIYCDGASPQIFGINEGSKEHVILSSIGGRKSSRNVCCEICNTRLGNEIDMEFSLKLAPLSNLFGIKTDRKGRAPTLSTEHCLDGEPLVVAPGGRFELKQASIRENRLEDGKIEISVVARTTEEADRLRDQYIRKFNGATLSDPIYVAKSTPSPTISHRFSFETNEKRSSAKMLLTLLATCVNPKRIRSAEMRHAIEFILGKGELDLPVMPWLCMEIPAVDKKYRFGHTAAVFASGTSREVLGVLVLFGAIKVTARLSNCWTGPTLGKMYCIDPVTGEGETNEVSNDEVDRCVSSYVQDGRPSNEEFAKDWRLMLAELKRRHQEKQVHEFMTELLGNVTPDANPEELRKIIEESVDRFVHEVMRLPYERKINT